MSVLVHVSLCLSLSVSLSLTHFVTLSLSLTLCVCSFNQAIASLCLPIHICSPLVTPTHRNGFNLLFYGLGSKKDLLQDFARSVLTNHGAVVTVNGYVHSLAAHKILAAAAAAVSGKAARCVYAFLCVRLCE